MEDTRKSTQPRQRHARVLEMSMLLWDSKRPARKDAQKWEQQILPWKRLCTSKKSSS